MVAIETLIGNLLLRHNCVIVPNFGGFVAKQIAAKIDFKAGKMSPPRKSLLFNKQLINNDGLLISELAQSNDIGFDIAAKAVSEKVATWNALLKSGSRIELDRVGFLFLDDEKNLCFEQDRFFNLLLESFGLGQVHFLSEQDIQIVEHRIQLVEKIEEKPANLQEEVEPNPPVIMPITELKTTDNVRIVEHPVLVKKRSATWKYIAAACFLPIGFYSIWIPMKTDVLESGVISLHDFNPFRKKSSAHFTGPSAIETNAKNEVEVEDLATKINEISADVTVYSYKFDEDLFVPVQVNSDNAPQPEDINNQQETVSFSAVHFIVGCFADKSNADNLVAKLKSVGLMAKIVDFHNGLHRVSAGGAMTAEGLNTIKMTANSMGLSGWVLK